MVCAALYSMIFTGLFIFNFINSFSVKKNLLYALYFVSGWTLFISDLFLNAYQSFSVSAGIGGSFAIFVQALAFAKSYSCFSL